MSGSFVSPELRARVRGLATPIAAGFGRIGLKPNDLTLIGFGIAIIAAFAAARQEWVAAGLLVVFGGVFDLFDGALARATGKASKLGAFMDSVFDRAGEGVVYVGIAAGSAAADFAIGSTLAASAMAAAFMVSYVRAKSESLGYTPGSRMASIGLAPREVRIVILTVGLLWTGYGDGIGCDYENALLPLNYCSDGRFPLGFALGLITILATMTTIQRIIHVIRQDSQQVS